MPCCRIGNTPLEALPRRTEFYTACGPFPLRWILKLADSSRRLARWRFRLSEFDFELVHRAGIKHQVADAISPVRTLGEHQTELDDQIPYFVITEEDATQVGEVPNVSQQSKSPEPLRINWPTQIPEYATLAIQAEEITIMLDTAEELLRGQTNDIYGKKLFPEVGKRTLQFDVDRDCIVCRKSSLDGWIHRVVLDSLNDCLLYLPHYLRLAQHPGESRMYQNFKEGV